MPWSNQTGGGWKGGSGGPWGQPPRGSGGPNPPDLEELLRRSQDRLKRVLPGGGGAGRGMNPVTLIAIAAIVIALVAYNFFTFRVDADELGVVLRFGEIHRKAEPGLNLRLPYPVERVYTPSVTRVNRVNIGRQQEDGRGTSDLGSKSLMLTGDENIVDIDFSVFWVINFTEPSGTEDFLFSLEDPAGTVQAVAESAMREVVGRSNIQPLLTQARQITEQDVQRLMQATLNSYRSGILITQVQLQRVDPPADVIAAFRDVQAARADQERLQNEAQTYANRVVPEARGQASQIIEAANAYRDRVIAEAQGQAERFIKIYEAYRAAPEISRKRIYLETMESILSGMDKIIVDEGSTGTGIVPYLSLDALQRRGAQGSSTPNSGSGGASQ